GPSGNPPGWKFISWMRASARARPRKRLGRKDAPHATAIFTTRRPRSSSSAGSTARPAPRERRNEAAPPHPPEPHLGGDRGVRADFGNPLLPRLGHPRVRNARGPDPPRRQRRDDRGDPQGRRSREEPRALRARGAGLGLRPASQGGPLYDSRGREHLPNLAPALERDGKAGHGDGPRGAAQRRSGPHSRGAVEDRSVPLHRAHARLGLRQRTRYTRRSARGIPLPGYVSLLSASNARGGRPGDGGAR